MFGLAVVAFACESIGEAICSLTERPPAVSTDARVRVSLHPNHRQSSVCTALFIACVSKEKPFSNMRGAKLMANICALRLNEVCYFRAVSARVSMRKPHGRICAYKIIHL